MLAANRLFMSLAGLEAPIAVTGGFYDKLVHASLFFACGFFSTAGRILTHRGWPSYALVLLGFAALTEFMQGAIPGRTASIGDFLADTTGASIGALAACKLLKRVSQST